MSSVTEKSNACLSAVSQFYRRWSLGKTRRRAAWAWRSGVVLGCREAVSCRRSQKVSTSLKFQPRPVVSVVQCCITVCVGVHVCL